MPLPQWWENLDAVSVADSLTDLVVKSLVAADFQAGDDHYRLLDTTRAYALEKLRGAGAPGSRAAPCGILPGSPHSG
jgi:predicted ATPase